jgi:hypothetical protein
MSTLTSLLVSKCHSAGVTHTYICAKDFYYFLPIKPSHFSTFNIPASLTSLFRLDCSVFKQLNAFFGVLYHNRVTSGTPVHSGSYITHACIWGTFFSHNYRCKTEIKRAEFSSCTGYINACSEQQIMINLLIYLHTSNW